MPMPMKGSSYFLFYFCDCPIIGVSNSGQSGSIKMIMHTKSNSLQN